MFKINNFESSPVDGKFTKLMGKYKEHVKFFGKNLSAIGFDMNERFEEAGEPKTMNFVGMLNSHYYKGKFYDQIEALDFTTIEKKKTDMNRSLEDLLVFV